MSEDKVFDKSPKRLGPDLLTEKSLDESIARGPGRKVTKDSLESKIDIVTYHVYSALTICILTLQNGFMVTGESACADPANFDEDIGKTIAYNNAVKKIWPLEGYLLCQEIWERKEKEAVIS